MPPVGQHRSKAPCSRSDLQITGREAWPSHEQAAQSYPSPHGGGLPAWRHTDMQQSEMVREGVSRCFQSLCLAELCSFLGSCQGLGMWFRRRGLISSQKPLSCQLHNDVTLIKWRLNTLPCLVNSLEVRAPWLEMFVWEGCILHRKSSHVFQNG